VTVKIVDLNYLQLLTELTERINPLGAVEEWIGKVDRNRALSPLNTGQTRGRATTLREVR
jgi:hypothetical protein